MPSLLLATGFGHGISNATSLVKGNAGIRYVDLLTGTPSVTAGTNPYGSGFYLECNPSAGLEGIAWDNNTITGMGSTLVVGFAFMYPTLPTGDSRVIRFGIAEPAYNFHLQFSDSDDKLNVGASDGTGTPRASANAIVGNTWYWIDLRMVTSGTQWTVDWAIDGVAQTQMTHTGAATNTISRFELGDRTGTSTFIARYGCALASVTSADYPLGPHKVLLLTADTGGTTAQIGTGDATSRFVTNSTADATHNSAQILTALTEGPPPTFGASASGVCQRTTGVGNAVGIPMTTYTLTAGETISGLRVEIPGWAATATTATLGFRTFNGTSETILQAGTVDPNFDADTAAPGWFCEMAHKSAEFDTQAELDALVVRVGYSSDASPVLGAHAIYAEVAIKQSTGVAAANPKSLNYQTAVRRSYYM